MQDKQNYNRRRQYYRIRYPLSYRPKARIHGEDYEGEVVELSERGVRFLYEGKFILSEGLDLEITITFHNGESFELQGEILKVTKEDIIVRFFNWLPLSRIMMEQLYLRNHCVGYM
ncbi:MAG: PilZ domain-containing protein [Candidatus Kariarchaeaceae archaeon]|jgi:hypothetical protein